MRFVLAGNYNQFKYRYPYPTKEIVYLCCPEQILGLTNYEVEKIGTWWERKDLEKIEDILKADSMLGRVKIIE